MVKYYEFIPATLQSMYIFKQTYTIWIRRKQWTVDWNSNLLPKEKAKLKTEPV